MNITMLATNLIASSRNRDKNVILRNINLITQIKTLLVALVVMGSASYALGDDNFALAPSIHDNLVIFGPKGERVAELSIPTISQAVTVGGTSFQISYGRDANNYITAILAPSSSQPQNLHFTVLKKTVDADKEAVVTLTFSDSRHVSIDPGYVGVVTVNSHSIRHRDLVDTAPAPEVASAPAPTPRIIPRTTASDVQPRDIPAPVYHAAPAPAPAPVIVKQTTTSVSHNTVAEAPAPANSAPLPADDSAGPIGNGAPLAPPIQTGSLISQPPVPAPTAGPGTAGSAKKKLYWAEPITAPGGSAPVVGIDQMKLAAVHGPVTVKLPDGQTKTGTDGMIVPSGSSILTSDNASAAVFMGGVDSARLASNTEAKVSENLDGSQRHTDINLKVGTIFSRVGHRPGEKQDFEVTTPEGVAAARGTAYAVCVTNSGGREVTVCATQDGVVTLRDLATGHKITITPLSSGQVSIGSVPALPPNVLRDVFTAFLTDIQQFNANMQAIAAMSDPSAADLAYYNSNTGFGTNTQFYDVNSSLLVSLYPPSEATEFLDLNNDINNVVPAARRALNQQLVPFGDVPLTPF